MTTGGPGRDPLPRSDGWRQTRGHLTGALIFKLRLYVVLLALAAWGLLRELTRQPAERWWAGVLGLLLGLVVGLLASRSQRLTWDEQARRVIGVTDALGGSVLLLYLVFALNRDRLVSLWVPADLVALVSVAALAGAMAGQMIGFRRRLRRLGESLLGVSAPAGGPGRGEGEAAATDPNLGSEHP